MIIVGGMNSRIGSVDYNNSIFKHSINPDTIRTNNGSKILKWMEGKRDMVILNRLIYKDKSFKSNFTGSLRSQNDLIFSNRIDNVESFCILDKLIYSESLSFNYIMLVSTFVSVETIYDCAKGSFIGDHCDVSKRVKTTYKFTTR